MKKNLLVSVAGLLFGFVLGFLFANQLAKEKPPASSGAPASDSGSLPGEKGTQKPTGPSVSEDEIRDAISRADSRAGDISLQRNFGLALYRYSNQTRNPRFLPDVARLLGRAHEADPGDRDLTVSLANVLFDCGRMGDLGRFEDARALYLEALESKPDDLDVRIDLGLTYALGRPSDPGKAIDEYRQALAIDSRHERALEHLSSALIAAGRLEEAQQTTASLERINPSNASLPNLRAELAQRAKGVKK